MRRFVNRVTFAASVGFVAALATAGGAGAVVASSSFDTNDEGWRFSNAGCISPTPVVPTYHNAGGGDLGNFISGLDFESGAGNDACSWVAHAPAAFSGDM